MTRRMETGVMMMTTEKAFMGTRPVASLSHPVFRPKLNAFLYVC
jgi:hypothetical protein